MVHVELEGTSIKIQCNNAKDLHGLYFRLGADYTFIVNGDRLARIGEVSPSSYFGGYVESYFSKKYFENE